MIRNSRNLAARFSTSPASLVFLTPRLCPGISPFHCDQARTLETLAYEEIRPPGEEGAPFARTAFVFHGLLGSGRNWKSFARNLASKLRESQGSSPTYGGWRMVLVDLRNHGKSATLNGLDPPHDMQSAARDVANLVKLKKWSWPDVIIGHSMGGKVALQFAESCSQGDYGPCAVLPKQLWVLDSGPGLVNSEDSDGEVEKVLSTLEQLPSSLPSRKWVVDHMLELGFSRSLSEWIGSNLAKVGEQVTWSFDLQAAISMFNSYRETDYWSLLEHPPTGLEIAIVQADNSDRWSPSILERLRRLSRKEQAPREGRLSFHTLPNSGHWVHVDNPKGLLDIMVPNFIS